MRASYSRGAFTGAKREGMRGRIVQSSHGNLFLDEIGDMPLSAQTRLLRVLEEMQVTPLGCEMPVAVDLRVICASHRNLREMAARGEFREDLYYRLNGISMELLPPAKRTERAVLINRCIELVTGRQDRIDQCQRARARDALFVARQYPGIAQLHSQRHRDMQRPCDPGIGPAAGYSTAAVIE